ncbi:hypothetical protein G6F63_015970 [Rhizopus arrhizus]|nr:hypothetical protein G6F63_015970 [Rhizopus arrhizus]
MQIGTDVWRRGNAALGVMLGSGRADNTVVSDLTGYSAKGRVRGTAVGVYGTWLQQADGSEGAALRWTAKATIRARAVHRWKAATPSTCGRVHLATCICSRRCS